MAIKQAMRKIRRAKARVFSKAQPTSLHLQVSVRDNLPYLTNSLINLLAATETCRHGQSHPGDPSFPNASFRKRPSLLVPSCVTETLMHRQQAGQRFCHTRPANSTARHCLTSPSRLRRCRPPLLLAPRLEQGRASSTAEDSALSFLQAAAPTPDVPINFAPCVLTTASFVRGKARVTVSQCHLKHLHLLLLRSLTQGGKFTPPAAGHFGMLWGQRIQMRSFTRC